MIAIGIILLIFIMSLVVYLFAKHSNVPDDVCRTYKCINAMIHIHGQLDETVNPCDDFYNFACGNFKKITKWTDTFSRVRNEIHEELRKLFSEKVDSNDPVPFNMAKKFYKICINSLNNKTESETFMRVLLKQLGGWPVVEEDEWDTSSEWSWTFHDRELYKLGLSGLNLNHILNFLIEKNAKNSSTRSLYVSFQCFNTICVFWSPFS